jgi:hypothetical protein
MSAMTIDGSKLVPGRNVDAVNIEAGMRELAACGYDSPETRLVIEYALARWARGEEAAAERGAIDQKWHGIDLTCWRRVLAAAVVSARAGAKP